MRTCGEHGCVPPADLDWSKVDLQTILVDPPRCVQTAAHIRARQNMSAARLNEPTATRIQSHVLEHDTSQSGCGAWRQAVPFA